MSARLAGKPVFTITATATTTKKVKAMFRIYTDKKTWRRSMIADADLVVLLILGMHVFTLVRRKK